MVELPCGLRASPARPRGQAQPCAAPRRPARSTHASSHCSGLSRGQGLLSGGGWSHRVCSRPHQAQTGFVLSGPGLAAQTRWAAFSCLLNLGFYNWLFLSAQSRVFGELAGFGAAGVCARGAASILRGTAPRPGQERSSRGPVPLGPCGAVGLSPPGDSGGLRAHKEAFSLPARGQPKPRVKG